MVLVAGALKRRMTGMDSWLEIPQSSMAQSVVKVARRVEKGSEAGNAIAEAFSAASSPPTGPAYVEVPDDVWAQEAGGRVVPLDLKAARTPEDAEVRKTADVFERAKRPLIVVGGGANSPEGTRAIAGLLSRAHVPVASTSNGRGVVPEDLPNSVGRPGFGGVRIADSVLAQADFVLCLGCGLSDVSTYGFNITPRGEVHAVNLDPIWDKKPIPYSMHLDADAAAFAEKLAFILDYRMTEEWRSIIGTERKTWDVLAKEAESRSKEGYVNPSRFLGTLDRALPRDAITAVGQGLHQVYAYAFLKVKSNRSFLAAANMGAMGFVFPAVLGAKAALPEREVVGVMGDGEFMMTVQDMETAVRERIGAKLVVVNDNSYRVLLMRQKIQKMGRVFGTVHTNPDFAKLAEDFGASGMRIDSNDEIQDAVRFITAKSDLPRVLELRVDPVDLPPVNIQGSLMF